MTAGSNAIDAVAPFLSCPVCHSSLRRAGSTLRCERGHSYDIARQGYVSLFDGGRRANTGDSAEMVAARDRFLRNGHYAPIADAVSAAIREGRANDHGLIADLAGGTGYYLAHALSDRGAPGLSIDLSVAASRRAAHAHPDVLAVAADVWGRLPLADGSCSVALSVFGPRNGPEIIRVLRDDGRLVVVSPAADHLGELVERFGLIAVDPRKRERLDRRLSGLVRRSTVAVRYTVCFTADDIADEIGMGPSAHHVDLARLRALFAHAPQSMDVTVSTEVSVWAMPNAADGVVGWYNGSG